MLHRTVAPDLAAEAQRVRELKAQGKNPDGTPYVHLPGQNAPPPVVSASASSRVSLAVSLTPLERPSGYEEESRDGRDGGISF